MAQTWSVVTAAASGAQTQVSGSPVPGQERGPHRTSVRPPQILGSLEAARFIEAHRGWILPAGLRELYSSSDPLEPKKQADGCFREGRGRQQRKATSSRQNFPPYYAVMRPPERPRPTLEPWGLRGSRSLRHISESQFLNSRK